MKRTARILFQLVMAIAIVLAILFTFFADANAIETCMKVKVVQISPDHDRMVVVVVKNEDGATFMFDQIDWEVKMGQRMWMCFNITFTKGNFWTMDEGGHNEPFLSDKPKMK